MKPIRVLNLVTVRWYNACAHYALCMARALKKNGVQTWFAGLPGSPVMVAAEKEGFGIARHVNPGALPPFGWARSWTAMNAFCVTKGITHLVSHRGEDHLLASLAHMRGKGLLLHLDVRADIRRPKNHFINRLLYRKGAACHIVPSEFMEGYFTGVGIAPEEVVVLPQPFDGEGFDARPAFSPLRARLGLSESDVLAGIIARLDPVKGHAHLMAAINRLSENKGVKFLVSGETFGVTPEQLKAMLSPEARDRVFFMGRVDDVRELLHAMDIGLIVSTGSEAVCRVALEMGAAGLPVVGTAMNSIPEIIIHNKGGLIVPPADPGALASAVGLLAKDAVLRASMGQFNLERVRGEYGMDAFGDRLMRVLEGGA